MTYGGAGSIVRLGGVGLLELLDSLGAWELGADDRLDVVVGVLEAKEASHQTLHIRVLVQGFRTEGPRVHDSIAILIIINRPFIINKHPLIRVRKRLHL